MTDEDWYSGPFMQTYTGRRFWPTAPRTEDIDAVDIAHSLSLQCRYNGHVKRFYSVAEHCVLMSHVVSDENKLWALLHDATEAYVGDMVRPLKIQIPVFSEIEDRVMVCVAEKFGLSTAIMPDEVKDADNRIIVNEKAELLVNTDHNWGLEHLEPLVVEIIGWYPPAAEVKYIQRLEELLRKQN